MIRLFMRYMLGFNIRKYQFLLLAQTFPYKITNILLKTLQVQYAEKENRRYRPPGSDSAG